MILFLEVHDILWSKEINTQQRQRHISMDISRLYVVAVPWMSLKVRKDP